MPKKSVQQNSLPPIDLYIYGEIGESWWDEESVTASSVAAALKDIPATQSINLRINSPGGDVSHGLSIYNLLRTRSNITAYIDGYALSAASFIALAADTVVSPASSIWMVHNPATICFGTAADMRAAADALDVHRDAVLGIYTDRTGQSEEKIIELLDNETWFTGTEAEELGFATKVIDEPPKVEQRIPQRFSACFQKDEERLRSLGWSFAPNKVAASAARPIVSSQPPIKPAPTEVNPPPSDEPMTDPNQNKHDADTADRVTMLSDEVRSLKLKLSESDKAFTEVQNKLSKTEFANQYWQLRAQALSLYAVENKLTEEEYSLDFSEDPAVDIERLTSMSADDARIELKTVDRALRRAGMKSPVERIKNDEPAKAKLENTSIKSQKVDLPAERPAENPASPTGEDAKAYALRTVNKLFK